MSLESNIKDASVIAENQKVVNNFVATNLSKDYLAETLLGKQKISRRDMIKKNDAGNFYTRSRFIKYVNLAADLSCEKQNYFRL